MWRFKCHSDPDQKTPQPVLESKMHWHIDRLALAIQKLAQQQQEEWADGSFGGGEREHRERQRKCATWSERGRGGEEPGKGRGERE